MFFTIASREFVEVMPGEFSVAFMHTPMDYEEYAEAPPEWGGVKEGQCWLLLRASGGLREASQVYQKQLTHSL